MRKKGFSLVEMLVVLGIIALLSAILLPIFKGLREQVYKHQCMSNLQKIYHALRMYYLDTGTYPERLSELHGEGLPELIDMGYNNTPVDPDFAKSIISRRGIYPIFSSEFHCSANIDHEKPIIKSGNQYFIDPIYFNYDSIDPILGIPTYARVRTNDTSDPNFNKQLYAKEPLSSTVITWCYAHRDLNPDGTPRFGSKDIVLFLDGHTEVRETSEVLQAYGWLIQPRRR
ncbi:type II secretion system protein [bacterium]|nr:type II secretion system protein [bacterium]